MAHEYLVADKLNQTVAERAREAVLLATTVLGMSRTDVVDTYNHLARQHGVAVGTELDSSKVWLKMYRGVVSTLGLDSGYERVVVGQDEARTRRTILADKTDVDIIREHADRNKLEKAAVGVGVAKDIEDNANRGNTGDAKDSWECGYGEILANIVAGATPHAAVEATKLRHNDLKEVGKFVPEAYLTPVEDSATLIDGAIRPITSGAAPVVSRNTDGRRLAVGGERSEDTGPTAFGQPHGDEDDDVGGGGLDPKKAALAEALHPFLADKLSDRDYAGFMYLAENADDFLDRKLQTVRRGEGVETHEVRAGDIFGAGERTRPEFIEGLQEVVGYGNQKDPAAGARKFLSRLEEKIQKGTNELEAMLDKGIQPPLTEKAQERMNMSLQDLSRQIQR